MFLILVFQQGEGVPEVRKGACANHVRDVQNLLRVNIISIFYLNLVTCRNLVILQACNFKEKDW